MSEVPVDSPQLDFIEEIARSAGALTLSYFRKNLAYNEKSGDRGIVTAADVASENHLKEIISKEFPNHLILAEESAPDDGNYNIYPDGTALWVIDPIDGTTNYSKGNPYYNVSIGWGIVRNGACEVLKGVVFAPALNDLYRAEKGKGAYCNGERLEVSKLEDLHFASVVTGFSSHKGLDLEIITDMIHKLQNEILGLRINGAAALDLAFTARGVFNGFFEAKLSPWDLAAGALLVQEAGGKVVNYQGNDFRLLKDADIICGNQTIVEFLQNTVARHLR